MISGDFNYNLLKYEIENKVSRFLNLTLEHNMPPCITEPTRIVDTAKPSLVDNIFINSICEPISGNILEKVSYYHLPNFILFESDKTPKKEEFTKTRDMVNFNEESFQNDLSLLHLENVPNLSTSEMSTLFHKHFLSVLNKHAPLKFLSKKERKTRQKPWLTRGIIKSIMVKRKLFRHFKNSQNKDFYIKYKIYRDLINKLCRKSKKMHYKSFLIKNANNIQKTWSEINKILNRKRKEERNINLLLNDFITSDKKKIANSFNLYFTNVADNLYKNIPSMNNKYKDYLKDPNEHSFFLNETSPHEISLIILALPSTNTTDIYGISTKFVKFGCPALGINLSILFNKSINEGTFPDIMKL